MSRRMLLLALTLGLVTTSLGQPSTAVSSCEECASSCNQIPMDPTDCQQLYCPECAGSGTVMGVRPVA
jgi:hypothetical protein